MVRVKKFVRVTAAVVAILMLFAAVLGTLASVRAAARVNAGVTTTARAMCCIEVTSGRVLYEKNADTVLPMASTTKIITAITVIENVPDLDEIITIDPKAVGIAGTSIYLQKGEELSVRELLLGLMLRSGNDAAVALALCVSPSLNEFCAKMEQTARKAGATSSSFKNPHGLDEEGHYTTARDLALVSAYAMRNATFREIAGTKEAKISGREYPRLLQNKNRLLRLLDGCVGVKTGFTKKAGRCYVGAREAAGMTVVCAVLNCGPMFEECEEIMKTAAEEYTLVRLLTADEFIKWGTLFDTPVTKSPPHTPPATNSTDFKGIARANFFYPLREDELADIKIALDNDNACVFLRDKLIHCTGYNRI